MTNEKNFVFHNSAKIQKCIFVVEIVLSKMDFISHYDSPLGSMTMASDGTRLVGLWFNGQKYFASTLESKHEERDDLPVFEETRHWLDLYFAGKDPGFTPALFKRGNVFRRRVWEVLLDIPYGRTMTYGDIARAIAKEKGLKSMSAQAVGGAVGHNPISLIIPCHRVIGTDGSLTGYAGGIEKKRWLIQKEQNHFKSKSSYGN
jgi:methylated-DNA-[protein]-cysteine S-methyltransferase